MSYLRDRAFVLRAEPFREQDRWLTCYGRTLGKFTAVARGSRKLDAKHLGHIEPLSEVEMMVAKGAAFDKVAVARLVAPRLHVRRSLSSAVLAGAAADFVDRLTHPGAPDPYIYELLQEAMDVLLETPGEITSVRGQFLFATFSLKILRMLGHVPDMDRCGHCRTVLKGEAYLMTTLGIVVCGSCRQGELRIEQGTRLPERAIPLFLFVSSQPLQECLKLTAPQDLLEAVQAMASVSLRQTPIYGVPHGFESVGQMLEAVSLTV